eukprot:7581005-Ditylum_brightwellii.AAC.1
MDLLLKNALEKAIEPVWLAEIHTVEHRFGNRSFLDAIIHLYQRYGSVSPEDLRANADKTDKTFDPNQPITLLFNQIEDGQKFATAAGVSFTHDQLVKKSEQLVLATG